MRVKAVCTSHQGYARKNNEDNFYFDDKLLETEHTSMESWLKFCGKRNNFSCFGVFDGMGGEEKGELASYLAAMTCAEEFGNGMGWESETLLERICQRANSRICEAAAEQGIKRMGSTAAILYCNNGRIQGCNLGDSRIYRFRSGKLQMLSEDHTDRAWMEKLGMEKPGAKNTSACLMQFLGIPPEEMKLEPHMFWEEGRRGDIFLLCSDGLTDAVADREIEKILGSVIPISRCGKRLLELVLERGGKDNVTIIICKLIP